VLSFLGINAFAGEPRKARWTREWQRPCPDREHGCGTRHISRLTPRKIHRRHGYKLGGGLGLPFFSHNLHTCCLPFSQRGLGVFSIRRRGGRCYIGPTIVRRTERSDLTLIRKHYRPGRRGNPAMFDLGGLRERLGVTSRFRLGCGQCLPACNRLDQNYIRLSACLFCGVDAAGAARFSG